MSKRTTIAGLLGASVLAVTASGLTGTESAPFNIGAF